MVCGGTAFLLGFFGFLVCFMVVNRGEFVVECVAKRGLLTVTFLRSKNGTAFELYFFGRGACLGRTRAARENFWI
jgi:hypothetical protein